MMMNVLKPDPSVKHIAIIPDGNRRWAKEHGLSVLEGHKYVAEQVFPQLIAQAIESGVEYLTFWVFSRENWQRSQEEVDGLMHLFKTLGMNKLIKDAHSMNAKVRVLGNWQDFSPDLQASFAKAEAKTAANKAITVNIALSYSGRNELVRAVQKLLRERPDLKPEEVDEALLADHLDTVGIPDPDLIIRTSGEQRLSGLFPWQSIYSELYFTPLKMPDFGPAEFRAALEEFQRRQRRFGQ